MEGVDVACSTSELDCQHGIAESNEELQAAIDCSSDAAGNYEFVMPRSVGPHCSQCCIEMLSGENGVNSGVARVGRGSLAAAMVDVACGSDTPVAAAAVASLVDVSCDPDGAVIVDVADADCAVKKLLERSGDSVLPEHQFDRHTVDLLAFLLALYNLAHYTVDILANSSYD